MDRRELILGTSAALGLNAMGAGAQERKKLLFFTKSAGFEHSVIKRNGDELGHAEKILTELGGKVGIDVTCTKDGRIFTREKLAAFDAFFFYTTGDLTQPGTDGNPPMSPEGKQAFLDLVKEGKGFIGAHSASDTFHTQPDPPDRSNRYINHGDAVDPYIAMLGGEFIRHGPQQKATMTVADTGFPGLSTAGAEFELMEEWYSLKEFAPNLHVILIQETKGMKGSDYERPPYPATWSRMHGKGRVFYTSMGHREDVWTLPLFQKLLMGGINWTLGRVSAGISPNLSRTCPDAMKLPPRPA